MKGMEFLDSKWVKEGSKPEAVAKIKAGFGRWTSRVGNSGLLAKARQLYEFFLSPEVSGTRKTIVAGALLYVISPLDLIPDFIPVVGWLDDLGIASFALSYIFHTMNEVDSRKNMENILEAEIDGTSGVEVAIPSEEIASVDSICVTPDLRDLQSRLDGLAEIADRLSDLHVRNRVEEISATVNCARLMRVGVVGRYSTGKSTLLNALLGQEILPTAVLPSTKVLTYIMRGKRPNVMVQYSEDGHVAVMDGLEGLSGVDDTKVASCAVIYPAFPYDGIVFVDTPGLQDTDSGTSQKTLDAIPELDAVVVVLDSNYLQAAAEFEFIGSMLKTDRNRKLFVVINKIEDKKDDEIATLEGLCRSALISYGVSNVRLFSLSAQKGIDDIGFVAFEEELRRFLMTEIYGEVISHAKAEVVSYANLLSESCKKALSVIGEDSADKMRKREDVARESERIIDAYDNQLKELNKKLSLYRSRFFLDFDTFINGLKVSAKDFIATKKLSELKNSETIAVDLKKQIVNYVEERAEEINEKLSVDITAARSNIENFLSGLALPVDVKVRDLSQYSNLFLPVVIAGSYVFCGFFTFVWCVIAAVVGRNFFETAIDSFLKTVGVNTVRDKLADKVSESLNTVKSQLVEKLNESFDMLEDQIVESFEDAKANVTDAIRMPEIDTDQKVSDVRDCYDKLQLFISEK